MYLSPEDLDDYEYEEENNPEDKVGEVEQASKQDTPAENGQLEPEANCDDHDDRFSIFGLRFIWKETLLLNPTTLFQLSSG